MRFKAFMFLQFVSHVRKGVFFTSGQTGSDKFYSSRTIIIDFWSVYD